MSISREGWEEFVHHLLTVAGLTSSCSANHLLVLFLSARITFMRFRSLLVSISENLKQKIFEYKFTNYFPANAYITQYN